MIRNLKIVILTAALFVPAFICSSCGSGVPTPVSQPVPIEFDKASTAVDVSALVNVQSQTVGVGTDVCNAVRSAFVTQMNYLVGLTVEGGETVTSAIADIDGNSVYIDFSAWDSFGCSGNSGVFPVCYRGYVDGIRMFAGHIDTAPTAAASAGEAGTMWVEFNPNGTSLGSSIGQNVFMKAVYNLSSASSPSITIDFSGDLDGAGEAFVDMTVSCLMSKDDALGVLPITLLEMNQNSSILYVARTDGSGTSVKVEGGDHGTGGGVLCVDNQGAASSACSLVDVAGIAYPPAASDYIVSGSDFPMTSEGACLTDDDFLSDTIAFTSNTDRIKKCWRYMPFGSIERAMFFTVSGGVMHYDNSADLIDMSAQRGHAIVKAFDATTFTAIMTINEASQTTAGQCSLMAYKTASDGLSITVLSHIGYRSALDLDTNVCFFMVNGSTTVQPSCSGPPSPLSPVELRLVWDGVNVTGWYGQGFMSQIGAPMTLRLGEYYYVGIGCTHDGTITIEDIGSFSVDAAAIGQE